MSLNADLQLYLHPGYLYPSLMNGIGIITLFTFVIKRPNMIGQLGKMKNPNRQKRDHRDMFLVMFLFILKFSIIPSCVHHFPSSFKTNIFRQCKISNSQTQKRFILANTLSAPHTQKTSFVLFSLPPTAYLTPVLPQII